MLFRYVSVRPMNSCRLFAQTLVAVTSLILAATAVAEVYTWKDSTGRVHYSDQPPPSADIKTTRQAPAPKYAPAPSDSAAASAPRAQSEPAATQSGPKSWQDKELENKQRRAAEQEADARRKTEEAKAEETKRYCADLRNNLTLLERGGRITKNNAAGERIFLDDAQIKQDADRVRAQLARDCK